MKSGSLIMVLVLVVALVLTAVATGYMMGVFNPPEEPSSEASPEETMPPQSESSPQSTQSAESKEQYNLLLCMVSQDAKSEFAVHIHSEPEALLVRQLGEAFTSDITVDFDSETPVANLSKELEEQHALETDGWAVVTSRGVQDALSIIGTITVHCDSRIILEDSVIERGAVTLGSAEILALLRDATATGDAVNFKIKVINQIIATVPNLSAMQKLAVYSKMAGKYKYDLDFEKVNATLQSISKSRITVEKIV